MIQTQNSLKNYSYTCHGKELFFSKYSTALFCLRAVQNKSIAQNKQNKLETSQN